MTNFKLLNDYKSRLSLSDKIIKKYPKKYPVIVEPQNLFDPKINGNKFLVPKGTSMITFSGNVLSHITNINGIDTILFYIGKYIVPLSESIDKIYTTHKDSDGFLYITYSFVSAFG